MFGYNDDLEDDGCNTGLIDSGGGNIGCDSRVIGISCVDSDSGDIDDVDSDSVDCDGVDRDDD